MNLYNYFKKLMKQNQFQQQNLISTRKPQIRDPIFYKKYFKSIQGL